ncbi:hypothetical protein AB0F81_36730 [Actinoplanes sp. NPDC024001]|uniref:hypothetical protein n=1 Tax=Actinoplanes sp. NPDC024001 TaxID=3154598 RepID=UPI00340BB63E
MKEAGITAPGALLIPAILYIFYSAVHTRWPESYVSASEDVGLVINRSVTRYLLFLTVPTYLVTLIVATTVDRFRGSALVCALLGAAIHVGRTQFAHYFRVIRRVHNHTRLPAVLVAASAAGLVFGSALLGSLGPGPFTAVVPPVDEFFKSLWTTMLVALLAVFAVKTWGDTSSGYTLVVRSRREVGPELLAFAEEKAKEAGADPTLVEAVLLAENLQRPSWVRRLERWKGRIRGEGTYGVMQVRSDRPISDRESIAVAIERFFARAEVPREAFGYEQEALETFLFGYNPDENFIETTTRIIDEIFVPDDDEDFETADQLGTVPEAGTPEARTPEARTPEARTPEARTPEARTPEARPPDAWTPEARTPEARPPEAWTPAARTPGARRPEDGWMPEEPSGERLEIAASILVGMGSRLASPREGVASIASLSLPELRQLAEVLNRLPQVDTPESAKFHRELRRALLEPPADVDRSV